MIYVQGNQNKFSPARRRWVSVVVMITLLFPGVSRAMTSVVNDTGIVDLAPTTQAAGSIDGQTRHCTDLITCELPGQIANIDHFLRVNKVGAYTPDPRPLTPMTEVIRLNIVPQALGYINLYHTTRLPRYRREAIDRLNYLRQLGPSQYGGGVRAGMVGYAFLIGADYLGMPTYLTDGLRIADDCVVQPRGDMIMNGGLMCGFNLTLAYRLTGQTQYQTAARAVINRTSVWQFANGAFPHLLDPRPQFSNSNYSAWMVTELLMMHRDDPGNELNDLLLAKGVTFLDQRVQPDGSISYSDANGDYYRDTENLDSRYWTGELSDIALDLAAGGHRDDANKVLGFLFKQELTGKNRGGYPDKYNLTYATSIWEMGNPSVVRTSLIFWYLSMISIYDAPCSDGAVGACTVTPSSCSSLYQSLGQCGSAVSGTKTCLDGQPTSCFSLPTTQFSEAVICGNSDYCENDPQWGACYYTCPRYGHQLCLNGVCAGICYAVAEGEVQCDSECYAGERCPGTGPAVQPPATAFPVLNMCSTAIVE